MSFRDNIGDSAKNQSNKISKKEIFCIILGGIMALTAIVGVFMSMIQNKNAATTNIGMVFLSIILISIILLYLFSVNFIKNNSLKKILLIFIIYEVMIICTMIFSDKSHLFLPIIMGTMLIALITDTNFAFVSNIFFAMYAALLFSNINFADIEELEDVVITGNFDIIMYYLVCGSIGALIVKYTRKRKNIVAVAIAVVSSCFVTTLLLDMYIYNSVDFLNLILAILNGALSLIIAVGIDVVFAVNPSSAYSELANFDQPLIKRLLQEAEGTFHHSQTVASLAEKAAMDVGADYQLAKVASMYHDIGKLERPEYFVENQKGENLHDMLSPEKSARIIISHVEDGVALAKKNKLPQPVRDIIQQHQGTTVLTYFYNKACANGKAEKIDIEDFQYEGPKPQTKEAAIIMLADSVEAAIKMVKTDERTESKIAERINNVFTNKLTEGQLEECDLKFNELLVIKNAFMQVYRGMNHSRDIK